MTQAGVTVLDMKNNLCPLCNRGRLAAEEKCSFGLHSCPNEGRAEPPAPLPSG